MIQSKLKYIILIIFASVNFTTVCCVFASVFKINSDHEKICDGYQESALLLSDIKPVVDLNIPSFVGKHFLAYFSIFIVIFIQKNNAIYI